MSIPKPLTVHGVKLSWRPVKDADGYYAGHGRGFSFSVMESWKPVAGTIRCTLAWEARAKLKHDVVASAWSRTPRGAARNLSRELTALYRRLDALRSEVTA